MTKPAEITPTIGENLSSYQWILDVALIPADGVSYEWHNIPDYTAMQPNSSLTQADGATYANMGQQNQVTLGESFNLALNAKPVIDSAGDVIPGLALLIEASNALLDQERAADRIIAVRYYHHKLRQFAYQFTADVGWNRANTGNADIEMLAFTLTGKGDRKVIENPATAPLAKPVLATALPTGGAEGAIVRLGGTGMRKDATVTVGGVPATVNVVTSTAAYVEIPAGSAGAAPIIMTVGSQASEPLDYTRA